MEQKEKETQYHDKLWKLSKNVKQTEEIVSPGEKRILVNHWFTELNGPWKAIESEEMDFETF